MRPIMALTALTAQPARIDSYGPADAASHGHAAFIEQCGRYSAHLRAEALRAWLVSMRSKARFSTCQFIEGEPSTDDACKCGAPATNGVYCADHLERCAIPRRRDKPARKIGRAHGCTPVTNA